MVNKCSIVGFLTNYTGHKKGTVFPLPEDREQKKKWQLFANREPTLKNLLTCYKHFEIRLLQKTPKRVKLFNELKPVPTIIPESQKASNLPTTAVLETIKSSSRKPPTIEFFRKMR